LVLFGHGSDVTAVAWSPCGKFIASGSQDATVRIWNMMEETVQVLTGHNCAISCLAWSPDGLDLLSGDVSGVLRQWNTQAMTFHECFKTKGGNIDIITHTGKYIVLTYSSSFVTISKNDEGKPHVSREGELREYFEKDEKGVHVKPMEHSIWNKWLDLTGKDVMMSPNRTVVACSDTYCKISILDTYMQKTFLELEGIVYRYCFSGCGRYFAGATNDTIHIWKFPSSFGYNHETKKPFEMVFNAKLTLTKSQRAVYDVFVEYFTDDLAVMMLV
jgi:WD40 repeat protein